MSTESLPKNAVTSWPVPGETATYVRVDGIQMRDVSSPSAMARIAGRFAAGTWSASSAASNESKSSRPGSPSRAMMHDLQILNFCRSSSVAGWSVASRFVVRCWQSLPCSTLP